MEGVSMADVAASLGGDSDLPKCKGCFALLEQFGVSFEIIISSAHRTPDATKEWARSARSRGIKVIIAIAGGAAHLPGVVAAYTTLPVIGVPIETGIAGGLDSILSILQMPSGIPVATMPAGKSGGSNAALLAVSILSLADSRYAEKLQEYRENMSRKIQDTNARLSQMGHTAYISMLESKK